MSLSPFFLFPSPHLSRYLFLRLSLSLSLPLASATVEVSPVSEVVTAGDPVSVNCSSAGALSISWQHNTQTITPDAVNGFSISPSPPDDSSTLAIDSADHERHHGEYKCVAQLPNGTDEATFSISVHCE